MSLSARNWAWRQEDRWTAEGWRPLTSPEKFVLLCLAENENIGDGYAFPSVDTIAKACRLSRRTVSNALVVLESAGLVERSRARSRDGRWPRNIYVLPMVEVEDRNADERWVAVHGEAF